MVKLINKNECFFAGHRGIAGSAICRSLQRHGYENLLTASLDELDLLDLLFVISWFVENEPTVVVLDDAKIGVIYANDTYPAVKLQMNVIETAWGSKVTRFLFWGSSCIYLQFAEQPIKEESLLNSFLEPTYEMYALAKITGIKLCESLRRK